MAVRSSKKALRDLSLLLETDRREARLFFRRVQEICGPLPYEVVLNEVLASKIYDPDAIGARLRNMR